MFQPRYIKVLSILFNMNDLEMSRRKLDSNKHHNKAHEEKIGLVLVLETRADKIKPSGESLFGTASY